MNPTVDYATLCGVWVSAALTLCIFSFLYRDNPFYKFAEYLFVGCSAGYWMSIQYREVIVPNLFGRLGHAWSEATVHHRFDSDWSFVIPAGLGLLMVMRLFPKVAWVSRWPLAFLVGLNAGFTIVYYTEARILKQITATILPFVVPGDLAQSVQNTIIVVGVLSALVYFYFSVEHRGVVGGISRVGIHVLMIALGASFGYTVMARVSLLIGRMMFFKNDFWPVTSQFFLGGG